MALAVSRRIARFNRRVTNPIQGQYAWLLPPWAVIVHRGRRSGRTYRTPVNAFRRGDAVAVVVLYGAGSDWVRNLVAAGEGQIVRGGRTYALLEPRLIGVSEAGPEVAGAARIVARASGRLLVARLGAAQPGFGRGPAAG
jgi:deazaflavin-dependent oxidoreductase (nitroreductase family)